LVAEANSLDDAIRAQRIKVDDKRVEVRQLIDGTVNLLHRMETEKPVGRISLDEMTPQERARLEKKPSAPAADRSHDNKSTQSDTQEEDDELDILQSIVRSRYRKSQGKVLIAEDIAKSYGSSQFRLRPISLELSAGGILGIVGVNASGKTTLLRIFLGELRPTHGELHYPSFEDGSRRRNWAQIKNRMAYVSQTLPRWPGRIYDNLAYVASMHGHRLADIDTYLDQLLKRYGLDKFRDQTWDEISGGYKTRFEIVRALVSDPDILILDEPLAYLDIISQQTVLRQLRQLARSKRRPIAIVITSQQLYEIEAIANRLLVLEGGTKLFSGNVKELSKLIDDLAIEFNSTGSIMEIKQVLSALPYFRSIFATETGYIAVFRRCSEANSPGVRDVDFNSVVRILGQDCAGKLSYARDISNSCRVLFEPRIGDLIAKTGG
jgi:ABC-2 type transport system ATP-binding protein